MSRTPPRATPGSYNRIGAMALAPPRRAREDGATHIYVEARMKLPDFKSLPSDQQGRVGYILLWLLGVPIPILFLIYLLRGCT